MSEIIDIAKFQKTKKRRKYQTAEDVTRDGVASLLHSLHDNNFPIDDPEFQQDLALAFKFIHAAISKQYGLDSPFYEAIDKFKKDVKW
tara:strand:- start:325 stop:588 length:264 start_codon:yes stop_codon:yes gene_type:complete